MARPPAEMGGISVSKEMHFRINNQGENEMKTDTIIDLLTDASNAFSEAVETVSMHRQDDVCEPSEMLLLSHTCGVWQKLAQQLSPELVEMGESFGGFEIETAYFYKHRNDDDTCDWDALRKLSHSMHRFSYDLWKQWKLFSD
jgi:hypothetical protein